MATAIRIQEFFDAKRDSLALDLLTVDTPLDRECSDADISTPGLALSGFTERFPEGRMQVFGQTEMTYLHSLTQEERLDRLTGLFSHDVPAAFVTKGQKVPEEFLEVAVREGVPVFLSRLTTRDFFRRVKPYLERLLAPSTTIHGSLADVYGVGVLFVGKSGIGKSECVLDLVERGHRLVADDLVMVSRRGHDVLLGRGHRLQRHHMEIRGIGIIDVRALFGIRAIRQQKRVEVIVQLEEWDDAATYDRTGLTRDSVTVLDVEIPKVTIPLNPGKNITVISEVVAMNHLLKYSGIDSAARFDQKLRSTVAPVEEYLEEDYE